VQDSAQLQRNDFDFSWHQGESFVVWSQASSIFAGELGFSTRRWSAYTNTILFREWKDARFIQGTMKSTVPLPAEMQLISSSFII